MKKILILGSFPAPYRVAVFKGLSEEFDVDIFFATDKDENRNKDYFIKKDQFRYYVLKDKEDKLYFKKCIKNIKSYDLVLAYDWYLFYSMKVELKCRLYNIPYIINCDGAFIDERSNIINKIKYKVKSYYIKNATKCFASGAYAKKYFEYYGADSSNISIHNFTSLNEEDILDCPINENEKKNLREKLELSNKKTVLSIGQFIPRKGFDILLNVWSELDNDYQLVIIGGGDDKSSYLDIIEKKGLKSVKIIEFLPKEKILEYYKAADIFVLLTREDIWGLVINESMANGLPVITTNRCIAGLELIEDGVNGYILDLNNNKEIKNKIRLLLENSELYNNISKNNIKLIKNKTINNIVKSHISNIYDVIK